MRALLMLWLASSSSREAAALRGIAGPAADAGVVLYFVLLEAAPVLVLLYFYRRLPSSLELLPADQMVHSPAAQGLLSRDEMQALRAEANA